MATVDTDINTLSVNSVLSDVSNVNNLSDVSNLSILNSVSNVSNVSDVNNLNDVSDVSNVSNVSSVNICVIDNGVLIFECPHCSLQITVAISDLACHIFRHGAYPSPNNPEIPETYINPHESKENCEALASSGKIIGCCKPFKIIEEKDTKNETVYKVEICEYI